MNEQILPNDSTCKSSELDSSTLSAITATVTNQLTAASSTMWNMKSKRICPSNEGNSPHPAMISHANMTTPVSDLHRMNSIL
ncbi:hypothetical protein MHH52_07160 [Paenibacillus sp. FSL K6-0276]|uniref:hypothetical protein n=1 Tax=Paenibacillus sp. FSL K6-0276 TaxID=2921450 RepID=UPI0030EE14C0